MRRKTIGRRAFLKQTAGAALGTLGLPLFIPARAMGNTATPPPSERITMASIGCGGMGTNNLRAFLAQPDVQVLAVCDVVTASDEYGHWYKQGWNGAWFGREPARKIVEADYAQKNPSGSYKGCDAYVDFREIIARSDIDAVCITTPDHWHAIPAVMAATAGKDIYCEKPLCLTVAEGRAMVEAARRYNRVFQTGTQRRSSEPYRFICEMIRNGRIGKFQRALVAIGGNNKQAPPANWQPMPVPEWLDYEMWLGPAPWAPYHKDRCLYTFRFGQDYSGGQTTNLGAHGIDIVQWANGTDETGPVEFEDLGGEFPSDGLFTTATKVHFQARYANGLELTCRTQEKELYRYEGSDGWIQMPTYSNDWTCYPESLKTTVIGPDEIRLYKSNDHHRNFIDCIKSRRPTAAPAEIGHRSTSICQLGNIAMQLGRKLHWDPATERFTDSEEANQMLAKPLRSPWHL
jgi:predicted dehydrogenase